MKILSLESKFIFMLVITLISVFELAMSFYLPLISQIRLDLNASEQVIQLSVSSYLIGLGISSIIFGGLSDILGRRKMILITLAIFSIASYFCSITNSIHLFLILRFFQGVGAGGGWPLGNATLRDVYEDKEFSRIIILLHIVTGIIPAFSLCVGGYLGDLLGWRNSFFTIFIISAIMFFYAFFKLPETKTKDHTLTVRSIFGNYIQLMITRKYWEHLVTKIMIVGVLFIFMTNLPLIYIEHYGKSPVETASYIVLGVLIYVSGGILSQKLSNYYKLDQLIQYGLYILIISCFVTMIAFYTFTLSAIWLQILLLPVYFAFSLIFGPATFFVVNSVPKLSGSASALMLALEMVISSTSIYIVSLFYNQTIIPITIFTIIAAIISLIFTMYCRRVDQE